MTVSEANRMVQKYFRLQHPTEEDFFLLTEALGYLIEETKDTDCMVTLGSVYYERKDFDLALKYYEMAAEGGNLNAISNLGYIWYYGRTGEKNYEKAFCYFNKARQMGDLIAAYKVADMYKNGFFVEKDYGKYKEIIEELYPKVKRMNRLNNPVPEIYTRLAGIRREEGKTKEALSLYDYARDFLSQRLMTHSFFGDLSIMKYLIRDTYQLREFDPELMDLYDLYYVFNKPCKVTFSYGDEEHEAEAVTEDGVLVIRFDESWFRTVDDFFGKAKIGEALLTSLYDELYDFCLEENEEPDSDGQ